MSDDASWKAEENEDSPLGSDETTPDGGALMGSIKFGEGAADADDSSAGTDTGTDTGTDAGDDANAAPDADADAGVPQMKLCVYCLSEIDALATRCNRCAGYLPPAEGTDFKQHWTLLFCCVSILIACIWLPIEGTRNDLYASHSIAGGFLTIFAGYGIFASWVNLFHRKMIVWPALFMALDGLFVTTRRLYQLIMNLVEIDGGATKEQWVRVAGPGLWVILFCSLLVFITFMKGAAAGAKKDKERKEAARAARGGRR